MISLRKSESTISLAVRARMSARIADPDALSILRFTVAREKYATTAKVTKTIIARLKTSAKPAFGLVGIVENPAFTN